MNDEDGDDDDDDTNYDDDDANYDAADDEQVASMYGSNVTRLFYIWFLFKEISVAIASA